MLHSSYVTSEYECISHNQNVITYVATSIYLCQLLYVYVPIFSSGNRSTWQGRLHGLGLTVDMRIIHLNNDVF